MTSRGLAKTRRTITMTSRGLAWLVFLVGLGAGPAWSDVETLAGDDHAGCQDGGGVVAFEALYDDAVPDFPVVPARDPGGRKKHSDRFPNTLLITHDEKTVHFYDDLVKDRIVIVNFMYASCENICLPIAQNLGRVHELLGDRMGTDILILSLTIDSKVDDPATLRKYIARNGGEKEGWFYLTGDYDEIDRVRRSLGVYDLDPVIDADKSEHSGLITFGNDRTDRWAALPALMNSEEIVETVLRITKETSPRVAQADL